MRTLQDSPTTSTPSLIARRSLAGNLLSSSEPDPPGPRDVDWITLEKVAHRRMGEADDHRDAESSDGSETLIAESGVKSVVVLFDGEDRRNRMCAGALDVDSRRAVEQVAESPKTKAGLISRSQEDLEARQRWSCGSPSPIASTGRPWTEPGLRSRSNFGAKDELARPANS